MRHSSRGLNLHWNVKLSGLHCGGAGTVLLLLHHCVLSGECPEWRLQGVSGKC